MKYVGLIDRSQVSFIIEEFIHIPGLDTLVLVSISQEIL